MLSILATMASLVGVSIQNHLLRTPPLDAGPYHERIVRAGEQIPLHIGPWLGADVPVPAAAMELLSPNLIVSRRYEQIETGEQVSFLLVQVRDARDILGHYPPICYPALGWTEGSTAPISGSLHKLAIRGSRYTFYSDRAGIRSEIVVDNVLLLPDGKTCRDMDEVYTAAQDYRRRFFGAAQIQLVYGSQLTPQQRAQIFERFISANRQVIEQICSETRGDHSGRGGNDDPTATPLSLLPARVSDMHPGWVGGVCGVFHS